MKKLFIIIICIIACVFTPAHIPARADAPTYARAAVHDGYFFTQKDMNSSIFAVPYTYCVQVLRDDGDWYYVKYAEDAGLYRALYGYVLKKNFTPVYEQLQVTYLVKQITVTYSATDSSSSLPILNRINIEAAFYGTYYSGATAYSYVLCQGSFGDITGANDDYPLNISDEGKNEELNDDPPEDEGVKPQIITAVILIAVALCALALLFFTTRKPPKTSS